MIRFNFYLALFSPILLLIFPLFHEYFLRYGVMYSETYSAAFMIIGFSLITLYFYHNSAKSLIFLAGACFATASFFRGQAFPISVCVSLILVEAFFLQSNFLSFKAPKRKVKNHILYFLLGFYLPIGSYMALNNGDLFRVPTAWVAPFSLDFSPKDAQTGDFLVWGGMKAACIVDLERCEFLKQQIKPDYVLPNAKKEVFRAFFVHPINFSLYKLPIAWRYWMESSGPSSGSSLSIWRFDSLLILILFFITILYMIRKKIWLFSLFTLSITILIFSPPFLLHFEVRYLYLLKAFLLFLPFWLIFIATSKKQKKSE